MIRDDYEQKIKKLIGYPETKEFASRLYTLWEENKKPTPSTGTTTEAGSFNKAMIRDWNNTEDEPLVKRHNELVEMLWELVDEFHIGSGIWYTHYHCSDEWGGFIVDAKPILEAFIDNHLWQEVCNNWEDQE